MIAALRGTPARAAAPLLTIAAFLVGPIGFLAPLGLAPLLIVVALGLAAIAWLEHRVPGPPIDLSVALTLLCVVALASVTWAVDPDQSLARSLRLFGECVEGVLLLDAVERLDDAERRRVIDGLAAGLAVTAALAFADYVFDRGLMRWLHGPATPPTASNRGATVLAIMMWPVLRHLARRGGTPAALAEWFVAASAIALCLAASAQLALAVASLVFVVALWRGRAVAWIALVTVPLLVLAMPLVPLVSPPEHPLLPRAMLKPSAIHRLVIWQFTDARIAERPALGWGMDAARSMPGHNQYRSLPDAQGVEQRYELMPLHPHNGALQVWVELGAVGALIAALITMVPLARLAGRNLPSLDRAAGLASLAAAAVEVSLSYGVWQSWWVAALWLAAGFVAAARAAPALSPDAAAERPLGAPAARAPSGS